MPETLAPLTLPLHGSRLIEASAGTGKTWTIAALYLRLVLGHGGSESPGHDASATETAMAPFLPPLLPAEILVMTFTKAATRELSDRIRQRLVQAAACFRGDAVPAQGDAFLSGLLAQYPIGPARAGGAWRLASAAETMDDAAIYTIDAWCQRMLREHAFDSGSLFDEVLSADTSVLLAQAVRDYWRQQIYALPAATSAIALAQWKDVDALARDAQDLLGLALPAGAGNGELGECIDRVAEQRARALAELKQGWSQHTADMLAWFEGVWARKDRMLDGRALRSTDCRRWIEAVKSWANDPAADVPALTATARKRLTRAGVLDAAHPGVTLEPPACFDAFEALLSALPALPSLGSALRAHAAARVAERLQQLKVQAGTFGFDDMLNRLNAALGESEVSADADADANAETARRLRQRILAQYPVALIDEFQDTSPVQLAIFDRLYRIEADDASRALLLIGDPKQSIYGFRGADIHSYLNARRATRGRHHVLGTNRRSTEALVGAVNHLFSAAETRAGEGAFLFRSAAETGQEDLASDAGLPFSPVAAQGRPERLVTSFGSLSAITVVLDRALRSRRDSRERFAAHCADRIVELLSDAGAGFVEPAFPFQRLRPADIAVLVRTGKEAVAVRHALRRRGVASVYLSDKDSVWASDEARDLLRLLRAIAAPRDLRLARAALATALLASTLPEMMALASDDALFDARAEVLQQLHQVWRSQGVLAAVRRALHAFDLPARWLSTDGGERRLTNVLHLAELLQAASDAAEGEQALIRWTALQIDNVADATGGKGSADDAQVLRLESDADLVKVVTVHKSKGLEYPFVFLPFAADHRPVERKTARVVALPDALGQRHVFLSPTDAQIAAADKERQREDLRLLYVALTRARHGIWLGAAALKSGNSSACLWHRSGLGYLLSGPEPKSPEQLAADVHALAHAGVDIDVREPAPDADPLGAHERPHDQHRERPPEPRLHRREALPALLPAAAYTGRFDRGWSIGSYSALVRDAVWQSNAGAIDETPIRLLRDDEPAEANDGGDGGDRSNEGVVRSADAPWHRFPRGARAGSFLHGLLEWLAGEGFALDTSVETQQALLRRCEREGWSRWSADVLAWLRRVCSTPLAAVGVPLASLASALPEMEFWLPSDGLRAAAVDALCRRHVLPGMLRPALPERALHGLLLGFADLVFEHAGRYWVLDYKSNALGLRDADYTGAAMAGAMLEHRYDVQAALYLLALHRLLRLRLGAAYDPARHLGGAVYCFIRGVRSDSGGGFHVVPTPGLIEGLDALLAPVDVQPGGAAR